MTLYTSNLTYSGFPENKNKWTTDFVFNYFNFKCNNIKCTVHLSWINEIIIWNIYVYCIILFSYLFIFNLWTWSCGNKSIWFNLNWLNQQYVKIIDYTTCIIFCMGCIKATFSVHKLIPKNAQMTTLYTNWSMYITFAMIYYIRQENICKSFASLSYIRRISGLFIANAMWTHWHVLSKM